MARAASVGRCQELGKERGFSLVRCGVAGLRFGCLLFLASCGGLPKVGLFVPADGMPPVRLAGAKLLAEQGAVPGSYLVAFRSDLPRSRFLRPTYRVEYQNHYLQLASLVDFTPGLKSVHYITGLNLADPAYRPANGLKTPDSLQLLWNGKPPEDQLASITRVDFDSEEAAAEILNRWYEEGKIFYAEPNFASKPSQSETASIASLSETYQGMVDSGEAPWFELVGLNKALDYLNTQNVDLSFPPLVAIMDSGVDYNHPALKNRIWENSAQDLAGCVGDVHGCNTTQSFKGTLGNGAVEPIIIEQAGTACPNDEFFSTCVHGTHVAGLVAAEPDEDQVFGGMCPMCKILPIKIVGATFLEGGDQLTIADSSIVAGFTYVSRFSTSDSKRAIRLVNGSFGKSQRSRTVELLIRLLYNTDRGILVVAAAGNDDTQKRQYPAAFPDVLGVVNVEADTKEKAITSNYGVWTSLSAPGDGECSVGGTASQGIRSTMPGGSSFCLPGTSMASPIVAGIAALVLVSEPDISARDLAHRLVTTADPEFYSAGRNFNYLPKIKGEPNAVPLIGTGIVNAFNAVSNTPPATAPPKPIGNRVNSLLCGTVSKVDGQFNLSFMSFLIYFMIPIGLVRLHRRFF